MFRTELTLAWVLPAILSTLVLPGLLNPLLSPAPSSCLGFWDFQPYPILDSAEQPQPLESPVFSGTAAFHILSYSTRSDTSTHMGMRTHSLTFTNIPVAMAPVTSPGYCQFACSLACLLLLG